MLSLLAATIAATEMFVVGPYSFEVVGCCR